jgi:RNA polymerase sigma-70 factor, ECF subfamily
VNDSNAPVTNRSLDADLIRRAQQGDSEAFATLFHAHKMRIYSLCLRMTNNVAEAEDLAQDAFLQVFRKLATFRGDSALSTWLYRIAVNTVLMHFRRKTPCRVSLDEPVRNQDDSRSVRREYGTRDGRLDSAVTRVTLTRAISELPEGYRAIFLLHEVDGYQHREIAQLLGCSVGNSKSQLHKAKLEDTRLPEPARHRGSRRRARGQGEEHRQAAPGCSQGMADGSGASYEYRFDRRAGASQCGLEAQSKFPSTTVWTRWK